MLEVEGDPDGSPEEEALERKLTRYSSMVAIHQTQLGPASDTMESSFLGITAISRVNRPMARGPLGEPAWIHSAKKLSAPLMSTKVRKKETYCNAFINSGLP